MSGLPNPLNPLEWLRMLLDLQRAQLDVTQKVIDASTAMLDAEGAGEAGKLLQEAGQQALDEATAAARAQLEWLSQWRC